ncbi:hypothetical protein ASPWEDRAFT_171659 [Aspergillus wentii DTO 134E9]|uniref:Uncharacterized protein n=1 Tax=Aspergillus wentii DTO 134E9 TaxID=1073089 RepID=A0A1L9RIV9_ASPWE|nr:uncharacterized protein ASPWEDRAFT_171659 [Aspergillus wentii DTO 134E9]KAI9932215.1 hypothetical protein MW887_009725 [Aspergillus wentii]OJJ34823.1 hypothetical protein ASPWEDRAFT_171659 [Aspergillus wentii DTO 134E9]
MTTSPPRPEESSILGESWVVPSSTHTKEEEQQQQSNKGYEPDEANQSPHQPEGDKPNTSPSMREPAATISGPELIMPSICEAPISEASWVAPALRSREQPSSPSLKRRHRTSRKTPETENKNALIASKQERVPPPALEEQTNGILARVSRIAVASGRITLNLLLAASIFHMLILPEVFYQYRDLCEISTVSSFYPTSCTPVASYPQPQPQADHQHKPPSPSSSPSRYNTVITSQAQLESLFHTTLQEMAPFNSTLKQSESMLRDIQTELKQTLPGMKHELDLEFDGCWHALRAAIRKFDSLRADIQSAVDSLVAAGNLGTVTPRDSTQHSSSHAEVAKDARLSTQMVRREQYLAQLTSRMQSKSDSLANDFATLADHLESIQSVVDRDSNQKYQLPPILSESLDSNIGLGFRALVNNIPSLFRPAGDAASAEIPSDESVPRRFRDAASYHLPVAKVVRGLLHRLEGLQKKDV